MKRTFILIVLTLLCTSTFAQTVKGREAGYRGSVSVINQALVCVGLETSHGVMINPNHYIGAGVGAYVFPNGTGYPTFAEVFIDYQAYFLKKSSTPFAELQTGYSKALRVEGYGNSYNYWQGASFQPSIGWSWSINSGCGLSASAGANIIVPIGENPAGKPVYIAPRVALTFAF